ncbi:MAG: HTH domain-containing protein [Myxococcaceae bacterium]|nr:HTH domain-containing protein [Myxococcaceae bacterium]
MKARTPRRRVRPASDADLTEAERRFVERIGLYFEEQGAPRIGGRILGLLMLSESPVSLEELAERLQVARASVSTNVRQLMAAGICEPDPIPGDRRHYYRYVDNAWTKHLERTLRGLAHLESIFNQALSGLGPHRVTGRRRLRDTADYLAFSRKEIAATLERWHDQANRASTKRTR